MIETLGMLLMGLIWGSDLGEMRGEENEEKEGVILVQFRAEKNIEYFF